MNLPLLGTAGMLLRAKRAGHLHAVRPVLSQLAALGFRLTPETVRNMLDLAGE
jgi:predicted nucleic acid-binding protein